MTQKILERLRPERDLSQSTYQISTCSADYNTPLKVLSLGGEGTTLLSRSFFVFPPLTKMKKRNLCQVVFTICQHSSAYLSKSVDAKESRSLIGVRWHRSASECSTQKQTRPGRGFFFPSHQIVKFKETSAKQGKGVQMKNALISPVFP